MEKAGLIVFVKTPLAGEVKTRLAADIGNEKALNVYWQLLELTKNIALQFDGAKMIWSNKDWAGQVNYWPKDSFEFYLQKGVDLGEKMSNALAFHFEEGFSKLMLIGSDCPEISISILNEAIKALDQHDLVIGPAKDGGYYLIAMKNVHKQLFTDMEWSHAQVLEQTILRADSNLLKYYLLPTLSDVDNVADLKLLSDESEASKS